MFSTQDSVAILQTVNLESVSFSQYDWHFFITAVRRTDFCDLRKDPQFLNQRLYSILRVIIAHSLPNCTQLSSPVLSITCN